MCQTEYIPNKKLNILSLIVVVILTSFFYSSVYADSLQVEFEQYFSTLSESFNTIASSRVLRKTRLYSMDRFFVASLKRHQTIYSFIRTNSKGVIISEVIRGQNPERNFRKVRDQKWFNFVQQNQEDYHTLIKIKETGRYYLLWCKPVLKGNKYFVGAVAVKIDLWDCIHKISSRIDEPFLIRIGSKSLYSYKWKNIDSYDKVPLDISGAKNIFLLIKKEKVEEEVVQESKPSDTAVIAMTETKKKLEPLAQKKEVKKKSGFASSQLFKASLIFGIFVVIILVIVAASYISRLRQRTLWQKIDEGKL